jgi:hypothetical protein
MKSATPSNGYVGSDKAPPDSTFGVIVISTTPGGVHPPRPLTPEEPTRFAGPTEQLPAVVR